MGVIATLPHPFVSPWTVLYAVTEVQLERLASSQIEAFVLTCAGEGSDQTYVQACIGDSKDLIIEIHAPRSQTESFSARAGLFLRALGFHPPASRIPNYWLVVPSTSDLRWLSKMMIDAFVQSWAITPSHLFTFGVGDEDKWIAKSKAIHVETEEGNWFRVSAHP